MDNYTKKLSFVIPCYNSQSTIEPVIEGILKKVSERDTYDYEIITINDCSPDDVISVLHKISKENPKVKVVDLAKNVGKHTAVLVGYRYATGDYVISLDDDGQCPIENLWELIKPLEEDHDMAMAKYMSKNESFVKQMGSRLNHKVSQILLNKPKELVFTNFIARQNYICKAMAEYDNIFPYLEGLTLQITRDIVLVPMEENPRMQGKSNYTLKKSISLWMNGFTAFSVKPLRISVFIGTIIALLGFIFGLVTIIRKIINPAVAIGYSSIMVTILFCSGMILMMLGLIGEYLGRVYMSVNNYPQYVVKHTYNIHDNQREEI